MTEAGVPMNVPKLRFPEFSEVWTTVRFAELCELKGRIGYRGYTVEDIVSEQDGAIALSPSNISSNGDLQHKNDTYISWFKYEESPEIMVENGHILLVKTGSTYGKSALVEGLNQKATVNPQVVVIKPINSISRFLHCIVVGSNFRKKIHEAVVGGALPTLSQTSILNFTVSTCSLPEQQKIADVVGAVDARVGLLRRRHEALTAYKKGMMQRLFGQSIRFTNSDGSPFPDWQFCAADALFKSVSNKNHHGELAILAATQDGGVVPRDQLDMEIQSSEASVLSYKIVEAGDFVISLRSFQGGIEHSSYHGICSPAYTVLKSKLEIADGFYSRLFKTRDFVERLSATVVGIRDGKQISYSAFSTLKLPYPHPEEQRQIADFLTALDTKIDAVTAQITAMQRFKQGLLQQMFV